MLDKSLASDADTIIYDLEDSVASQQKKQARDYLMAFLRETKNLPHVSRIAIRVNAINSDEWQGDIIALNSIYGTFSSVVVPKVNDKSSIACFTQNVSAKKHWNLIASIESPRAIYNVEQILAWKNTRVRVDALLVSLNSFSLRCQCSIFVVCRGRL